MMGERDCCPICGKGPLLTLSVEADTPLKGQPYSSCAACGWSWLHGHEAAAREARAAG